MKTRCFILIFALIFSTALIKQVCADGVKSKIYEMTAAEVEEVVSEWLKNHDFEV